MSLNNIPDIPELIKIKKQYSAYLMIDEAHSIGVLGKTGHGIREHFNIDPKAVDIWMGTLSKALGSCGGYLAGSHELIDFLRFNADGFLYSAAITPANTAAALASLKVLENEPERVAKLHANTRFLTHYLRAHQINIGHHTDPAPVIPILVGDSQKAVEFSLHLKMKKILAYPLFYPAVKKNQARLRLFVNSALQKQQLEYTAQNIIELWKLLECDNAEPYSDTGHSAAAIS